MYWDQRRYRGRWKPHRHVLGPEQVPAFDGTETGEEFQCAQAIDSLPRLKFWLRNVARHPNSFWLPTATERARTREKRTIGQLWEKKSGGTGLFIVVEKTVDGKDMRTQMVEKIA